MIGNFQNKDKSSYQEPEAVRELTRLVQQDFQTGWDIQHRPYREFNNMSVLDRLNRDQDDFNIFEPSPSEDPDKAWRSTSVSPMARNKVIGIAAQLMVDLMYPNTFAYNDNDDPEKDAAQVMRKMMIWNMDNSDYEMAMLYALIQACSSPCAYLSVPYYEAIQKLRQEFEDGDVGINEVVDDVLSGIQFENISVDEILINNIYQREHQKQKCIIRTEYVDYEDAKALHGDHQNWKHVEAGTERVFDATSELFYDSYDDTRKQQVRKVTYKNRAEDIEVVYCGGVYLGDENTENNPIVHRTIDNKPRYNEVKFGYEPLGDKFYYYKSAVNKLSGEKKRIDRMHRFIEDGTHLEVIKPFFTTGAGLMNSSVVFPGAVTDLPRDAQVTPFSTNPNLNAGYQFIQEQENRANQSTQDPIRGGASSDKPTTAYEISRVELNAAVKEFGIFGRMVADGVEKVGELLLDNILWHQTLGEVDETVSSGLRLKFRSFLLPSQNENGKTINEKMIFTDELVGMDMTEKEQLAMSYRLLREGGAEKDLDDLHTKIYLINPYLVRKFKYILNVEPDKMLPKSSLQEEQRKLRGYQAMIADPSADQRAIARDFLFEVFAPGDSDKYMRKAEESGLQSLVAGTPEQGKTSLVEEEKDFLPLQV